MTPEKDRAPTTASSSRAVSWREVKARARAADPSWDSPTRVARRAEARKQRLAAVEGAQPADLHPRRADVTPPG